MQKKLIPGLLILTFLLVLSACGGKGDQAPATATLTISPTESTVTNGSDISMVSTQYFTIVVKDAQGIPLSDVALDISYAWAVPNAYGFVQLRDGETAVDSPMEATTDENGEYHLRFDFQSGGGLKYSASLEVTSGALFGSADFSVETGGN